MNNEVNNTNNSNNQNAVIQPVVQTQSANTHPQPQPTIQPITSPTTEAKAEEEAGFLQNIPGVTVAPPQQGGMAKPNPIVASNNEIIATEPPKIEEQNKTTVPIAEKKVENSKKKKGLSKFLLLIIVIMGGVIAFLSYYHQKEVARLNYECTPVSTTGDVKKLELNSTIVLDLYNKVKTSLKEDLAVFELNDQMKVYLAYRQIPSSKFYESNCNLFSSTAMEPFVCVDDINSTPLAFKEEDLKMELKKLFGERSNIPLMNVQLGLNSCLGGYQYIEERGEFVQGECTNQTATTFKMNKKLIKAESRESTIILYEEVKYYSAEGVNLPDKLKSGIYIYTFKLDTNYNYVYINKILQEK